MAIHDFGRQDRVGSEIQRELAVMLREEVRDPRLKQVTIQEVRVVRDLSHAKVYFTTLERDQAKQLESALNKAAGFLRHRLSEEMNLRVVPQLKFVYDKSFDTGMRLTSLIDQAIAGDQKQAIAGDQEQAVAGNTKIEEKQ